MSKNITHEMIAQKTGLARSTVTRILDKDRNLKVPTEIIHRVFAMAKELGYDFSRIRGWRRREFERKDTHLKAEIKIHLKNGKLFDSGRATIKDISPKGALLKRIDLPKKVLPLEPFTIALRISQGRLKGIQAKGEIVRFKSNGYIAMGMRFLEVDKISQKRLAKFIA